MNEFIYQKFLKELCAYFEKKLSKETSDVWYNEISKIPEESLNFITSQIKKKESFPRNFPAATWAIYYEWLRVNQKQALNDCPDCGGSGWLSENRKAYKCGRCNPEPLSVYLEIPGFTGFVNVKTKTKPKTEEDWHDQF
jgi:ribosomal protein S27AE